MTAPIPSTITVHEASRIVWDAVVIGAGPGGAVTAHELARADWRVLLLDRAAHPRPKVCGCCLAPAGVEALKDIKLGHVLAGADSLSSITVCASSHCVSLPMQGYAVLDRATLDSRLAVAARDAGADLLWPVSARVNADEVIELTNKSRSAQLNASVIVVADGLHGTSLKNLPGFSSQVSRRSKIGVGAILQESPVPVRAGELQMFIGPSGYLGMVRLPNRAGAAKYDHFAVAGAFAVEQLKTAGGPSTLAADVLRHAGVSNVERIMDARWSGTPPLTQRRSRVAAGRIFVVGDAAGFVEPFTGEGMSWAIESGCVLANLLTTCASGEVASGEWLRVYRSLLRSRHRRCAVISHMLRHPTLVHLACAVGTWWPAAAARFIRSVGARTRQLPDQFGVQNVKLRAT